MSSKEFHCATCGAVLQPGPADHDVSAGCIDVIWKCPDHGAQILTSTSTIDGVVEVAALPLFDERPEAKA